MESVNGFFSEMVLKILAEKGKLHVELAREAGIDPPRLSRIISGEREPKLSEAYKIAKSLNTPIEVFFPQEINQFDNPKMVAKIYAKVFGGGMIIVPFELDEKRKYFSAELIFSKEENGEINFQLLNNNIVSISAHVKSGELLLYDDTDLKSKKMNAGDSFVYKPGNSLCNILAKGGTRAIAHFHGKENSNILSMYEDIPESYIS